VTDIRRLNLEDFSALDHEVLRRVNEAIVLNLIRDRQPVSRIELARMTDLNESTITSIVRRLAEEELIYEAALGDSIGGRRPRLLRLNGNHSRAVGVYLGIRETTIGVSNFGGEVLYKKSIATIHDPCLPEKLRSR